MIDVTCSSVSKVAVKPVILSDGAVVMFITVSVVICVTLYVSAATFFIFLYVPDVAVIDVTS